MNGKLDALYIEERVLAKVSMQINDTELATAHVVCPNLFRMYSDLTKYLGGVRSEICMLEDKLDEYRRDIADERAAYKNHKAYYD